MEAGEEALAEWAGPDLGNGAALPPLGWLSPASPAGLGPSGVRGPLDQGRSCILPPGGGPGDACLAMFPSPLDMYDL